MRMYKNIVIVVLGATFAALAFAAPALADLGNSGFVSWGDVEGTGGNPSSETSLSPHGGFSTSTVKCAVCHAVHQANKSGSEVLLRSSVANACTYCHIDLKGSAETSVYDGVMTNYTVETEYGHQSYSGGLEGVKCEQCHQVHAAEQFMTANKYLRKKILIGSKTQDLLDSYYDPRIATAPGSGDPKDEALTKWCTRCHKPGQEDWKYSYYSPYYSDSTHVMKAAGAYAGDGTAATGKTVAWASSEYCRSCHSKGYGTSRWPHWSPSKRFLVSADSSSAVAQDITGATSTSTDGVCLRCHRDGTNGVGTSY